MDMSNQVKEINNQFGMRNDALSHVEEMPTSAIKCQMRGDVTIKGSSLSFIDQYENVSMNVRGNKEVQKYDQNHEASGKDSISQEFFQNA